MDFPEADLLLSGAFVNAIGTWNPVSPNHHRQPISLFLIGPPCLRVITSHKIPARREQAVGRPAVAPMWQQGGSDPRSEGPLPADPAGDAPVGDVSMYARLRDRRPAGRDPKRFFARRLGRRSPQSCRGQACLPRLALSGWAPQVTIAAHDCRP